MPASETSVDEVWTVEVVASDGEAEGEGVEASVTVINGAPVATALALQPGTASPS